MVWHTKESEIVSNPKITNRSNLAHERIQQSNPQIQPHNTIRQNDASHSTKACFIEWGLPMKEYGPQKTPTMPFPHQKKTNRQGLAPRKNPTMPPNPKHKQTRSGPTKESNNAHNPQITNRHGLAHEIIPNMFQIKI